MSGFGSNPPGGFGTPSLNQPFGSQQQQQQSNQPQQPLFGSGTAAPSFGGFGTSSSTAQASNPTTAINPPVGAFGTTPAPATQFGSSSSIAFGASNTTSNTSAQQAFGQPLTQTQTGFGMSSAPFGGGGGGAMPSQQQQQSSFAAPGFGISSSNAQANPQFGGGGTQSFSTTSSAPNPFGAPSTVAAAPAISFGMSSNIAPAHQQSTTDTFPGGSRGGFGVGVSSSTGFGVSSSTATAGVGSSTSAGFTAPAGVPWSSSSLSSTGFGTAPSSGAFSTTTTQFGQSSNTQQADNDEAMGDDDAGGGTPFFAAAASPFGPSTTQTSSSSATVPASQWPAPASASTTLSPVPEATDSSMSATNASAAKTTEEDEKLSQLKAKIEAKKKKLEEKRRREASADAGSTSPQPPSLSSSPKLNANAASFVPSTSSLADRNAERFASGKTTTSSHLPDDLKDRADEEIASAYKSKDGDETLKLQSAVSLVGTCQYMCPDDELLRREREGDIQLLETPQPGALHPKEWTLRNTAVKRFRRSAADYKLDVPEWIRPPDVLEAVCGYLEEWVMERDRQGPDPRFPQAGNPPSLDVYQFIWDRTRMVRKDFILQNYVGTGGKCDARAVRCHERIARWHAMCEHQLSHIPDFVKMQSQQNIQELGQTMKTLNQYYDDSLGRSAIEVPDDEGKETITSWKSRRHGCASNQVMGLNPVDFDGSLLSNDPSSSAVSRRLIGTNPDCPTHGTAEPEMRGLYILLTINNEGGMEVLRYAAYLFRERPEVYHSTPVQLALRIYKAKKEYNYARFFSILRSPSTPYLFACIMFKHVQEMRKVAFRIMSKTYGAKRKDTGEAVYDAYPLRHLVKLLCFEDEEEARTACRHFNITIKEVQMSSSSSPSGRTPVEVIFWRQSDYREPKDPEKGFALPLYPKKMIRTIEAKLKGTTRLGVCRGEVSGDGAALSQPVIPKNLSIALTPEQEEERRRKAEEARKAAKKASEDRARQLAEQEAKLRMEEKRRQREEKKRLEEEKLRLVEMERQKREEERLLELERRAEEERRQEEAREAARIAAEKAAAEERRRQIEEAKRRAAELELARKKAEARELERKRQEELMRQHEEQSRLERLRIEEEERKRKEAEREHQRLLEVRRQQEAAEQRRREEKARKLALAWEQKINDARKLLLWKRLRLKLERNLQRERSRLELRSIDPVFSPGPPALLRDSSEGVYVSDSEASLAPMTTAPAGVRLLELLAQEASEPFDLSTLLRDAFDSSKASPHRRMVLVKLAVILPDVKGPQADLIQELAHAWIGKRLQYGVVETWTSMMPNIVGVDVMVTRHGRMAYNDYDAALLVIPPYFGVNQSSVSDFFPSSGVSIPKVLLDLDDGSNASYSAMIHDVIRDADTVTVLTTGESQEARNYDEALWESCSMLLKDFVQCFDERQTRSVERVPLFHLAVRCIRASLWRDLFEEGSKEDAQVYAVVCSTLEDLVEDLDSFAVKYEKSSWWGNWPSAEFAGESGHSVPNFFGVGIDLPLNWNDSLRRDQVEPEINLQFKALLNDSFADIIDEILDGAPSSVRASCHDMIAHRQFRRCMEIALVWKQGDYSSGKEQPILYLPPGADSEVVARFSGEILEDQPQPRPIRRPVEAVVDGEPSRFEKETYVAPEQRAANLFMAAASTPTSVSARNADENVRTPASTVGVETPQSAITPAGVETPQVGMAPIGVETPLTVPKANIGSSKRARNDSEQASPGDAKRRQLSICQDESNAFTKKLESLLQGESTYNLKIGDSNLTDLLQDVPSIDPPDALQRSSR